jgi:hypothetical protein
MTPLISHASILPLALCVLMITGCSGHDLDHTWDSWEASARAGIIDADVPGTEVFIRGQSLGTVPVRLTKACLNELCSNPAAEMGHDGWGEGLFYGIPSQEETKIMLKAPDAVADRYLSIETPWGRRSKIGMAEGHGKLGLRVNLFTAVNKEGLRLAISVPDKTCSRAAPVKIELSCTNKGPAEIAGYRPEIEVLWGAFDTPWGRRGLKTVSLPKEWSKIAPGQNLTTSV